MTFKNTPAPLTRRRALTLMGAGLAAAAVALTSACTPGPLDIDPLDTWEAPYDWDAIMENPQGRKFYYPNGQLRSKTGLDVWEGNGEIDWEAVAADGIEFAFVRIGRRGYTEGGLFEDAQYEANLKGARKNGIAVGAYFFSSAVNEQEAREEANYALELLDGFQLEYPIVFDQEKVSDSAGRANNLSAEQYTANARAFCETVEAAGYQAMVYGNQHQLALIDPDELAKRPVWYAEYGVKHPTGRFTFTIWQYTAEGSVAGVTGGTDLNIQFLEPIEGPVIQDQPADQA